jgi:hypothetical protein
MKTISLARSLRSLEFAELTKGIYPFFAPEIPEIEGISGRRSRWIHDLSESIGKNTSFVSLSVLCGLCEKQVFCFAMHDSMLLTLPSCCIPTERTSLGLPTRVLLSNLRLVWKSV